MSHLELSGTVAASAHDIWSIVSEEERFVDWFPQISVSRLTNGKRGVGAERAVTGDMMGEWTSRQRITDCEPERECAWTHLSDTGKPGKFLKSASHRVTLTPRGAARTEITIAGDFEPKGMGTMMLPMIKMKMRKKYRGAIEQLDGLTRASQRQAT